jgi:hypothetical protein
MGRSDTDLPDGVRQGGREALEDVVNRDEASIYPLRTEDVRREIGAALSAARKIRGEETIVASRLPESAEGRAVSRRPPGLSPVLATKSGASASGA